VPLGVRVVVDAADFTGGPAWLEDEQPVTVARPEAMRIASIPRTGPAWLRGRDPSLTAWNARPNPLGTCTP